MSQSIVTIFGSPSEISRSSALLEYVRNYLAAGQITTHSIVVRDLPAEDLLHGRYDSPAIQAQSQLIESAGGVIVGTPVYKAAYSGVLKTFLDLLPQNAFSGKLVVPIATGGLPAHLLAIDYALKPVLSALGARHVLDSLYVVESQIQWDYEKHLVLDPAIQERLHTVLDALVAHLN